MIKPILTKPIDKEDLKRLSPITVVREYIEFNRKTQEILKETESITSYKTNEAGEVFVKGKHIFEDDNWHKDWQTPKMTAENISRLIKHPLEEYYTDDKLRQTRFTVYSETKEMKGYYNKKCKQVNVKNMIGKMPNFKKNMKRIL